MSSGAEPNDTAAIRGRESREAQQPVTEEEQQLPSLNTPFLEGHAHFSCVLPGYIPINRGPPALLAPTCRCGLALGATAHSLCKVIEAHLDALRGCAAIRRGWGNCTQGAGAWQAGTSVVVQGCGVYLLYLVWRDKKMAGLVQFLYEGCTHWS
eukprot:1154121-Pelagomonas_calceolata.AAC.5